MGWQGGGSGSGGGAVASVAASDSTLTVAPNTGAVLAAVAKALDHTYLTDWANAVPSQTAATGFKTVCDYATASALPACTYDNGAAGVGASLTATGNGALSVDGMAVVVGQRILVKNQASTFQNGIYTVTQTGDASHPFILTRATDFDGSSTGLMDASDLTGVYNTSAGTANNDSLWLSSVAQPVTVGTTAVTWSQVPGNTTVIRGGGGGGFKNPMTTLGDMIVAIANGVPARLPKGVVGQLLSIATQGSYYQTVLSGNPVRYYRFDDPGGTVIKDYASNPSNGAYSATGFGFNITGNTGDGDTAVTLDGANAVGTWSCPSLTDLSVELVFKDNNGATNGNILAVGTGNFSWEVGIGIPPTGSLNGHLSFWMANSGGSGLGAAVYTNNSYSDGAWHHAVVTRKQSTGAVTIYVDGVLQATSNYGDASAGTVFAGTALVTGGGWIGRTSGGGSGTFSYAGTLDDTSIYNYVFSAAQALAHFNALSGASSSTPSWISPPPAVTLVHLSASQSCAAAGTAIAFDVVDAGIGWDTTNHWFKAPVAGDYDIKTLVDAQGGVNNAYLWLTKNGSTTGLPEVTSAVLSNDYLQLEFTLTLAAGDTIQVLLGTDTGTITAKGGTIASGGAWLTVKKLL